MTSETTLLHGFRLRNAEQGLGAYGIHIHREGRPAVEHRFRADDRVNVYSGSKAVTSLAVGMARAEGLLDLDDTVVDHVGHLGTTIADGVREVTIRHLLHMTSGVPFQWFELPGETDDVASAFLSAEPVTTPGESFAYSNASTYMLGRIVHAVSGQDLRDFLMPRLFAPLGIANPQWHRCPHGFSEGAKGLHLTTSEFARVGRLLLQRGQWEGAELVPGEYVDAMHTDLVDPSSFSEDPEFHRGYGYQAWGCTPAGAWRLDGKYGQFSVILPEQRAVVTITAHNEGTANDLLRAVWDEVLPLL